MKGAVVFILFAALPAIGHDAQTCPWINAATAGWILEGVVTTEVVHPSQNSSDATCEFVRQPLPSLYALRIEVETSAAAAAQVSSFAAKCATSATELKPPLGNGAFACSKDGKHGQRIEEIAGRVRDRVFTVRITTTDPAATRSALFEKACNVAEQVAGILF